MAQKALQWWLILGFFTEIYFYIFKKSSIKGVGGGDGKVVFLKCVFSYRFKTYLKIELEV